MYSFRFKSHIADIRMAVKASSLEELFTGGLEGMLEFMEPKKTDPQSRLNYSFHIQSSDSAALIVDFLNEILTRIHVDKAVYHIEDIRFGPESSIHAGISGSSTDGFRKDVKAATYHENYIRKSKAGIWETLIIFDI
jgi:SHS2 domain-containing protein